MTTITLEVPDELAAEFNIAPAALPNLIREAVAAKVAKSDHRTFVHFTMSLYRTVILSSAKNLPFETPRFAQGDKRLCQSHVVQFRSAPQSNREGAAPIYQEIIDLLTSGPTADRLIVFKISDSVQERLEELLHKNREEELSPEERAELNTYLRLSEYVTKLKARARAGQPLMG